MGPPISSWSSHRVTEADSRSDKYLLNKFVDSIRALCLDYTVVFVLLQIFLCFSYVNAGPVVVNLDYFQGPTPIARNIRHLPCISRKTYQEGLCMFAIDCLKVNGTHLGTCIDRFYFGSCCQVQDKTVLPHIISNTIEDNSIDNSNFVHPQTEDHLDNSVNKAPIDVFSTRKPEVQTTIKETTIADHTESIGLETKSDEQTTLDNKIPEQSKPTTVADTTKTHTIKPIITHITESPLKISTFQTVSGTFTEKPYVTTENSKTTTGKTETEPSNPSVYITTKKPTRPTYKPRPTNRPSNFTKPPFSIINKPKPTLSLSIYNTTRIPYKPPIKLSTKRPLPSPPRLNITVLPASTISKPIFSKPSLSTITYISSTIPTTEQTTPLPTTTTTTTEAPIFTTEKIFDTTELLFETTFESQRITTSSTTETDISEKSTEPTTEVIKETVAVDDETFKPVTETLVTTIPTTTTVSTEYPAFVTWSSTSDATTKAPEKETTAAPDETWSPITPPEGWILISTVSSTLEPSSTSTTTTTTEPPTTQSETVTILATTQSTTESQTQPTTDKATETTISTENKTSLTTQTSNSTSQTTVTPPIEFTVNVTLTPASTQSTLVTTVDNVTESTKPAVETPVTNLNMSNYKEVCGQRLWPSARIVGGSKSEFGRWPWQISLRQFRTSTFLHKCGAALLNENWAITAAHCVEHVPPSELLIRLGEHDLATEDEPYGYAERRVQLVASHPHFDPATFEYDLALIRFNQPVTFQPNIVPVCVPDTDEDFVGRTAYVTGWGRLYDDGPLPSVLQEVEVPVINNTACEEMYQAAGYNEHIPNIFICAGWKKGGADSCEGDSGGPMVIPRTRDGRFVLSGIISWGIGCAEPNQPGVYTRISEFRDWINQILKF